MRPPSPPPVRWLCVLAGALACALGPAGGRAARLQQECDYLQMIEVQHKQCLEEAQLENETAGCSKMWDNLTCWPATPRGQVVVLACPLIFKLFSPIQGRNVSRSCTDEGWTQLEPGPYPIACGLDDKASSLDEVGLSAPTSHPQHTSACPCSFQPPMRLPCAQEPDSWDLPSSSLLSKPMFLEAQPLNPPVRMQVEGGS